MEKECKICKVIRPFKDYYSCLQCSDGKLGVCKICKKAGKTIRGESGAQHKFNIKWSKRDDNFMRMSMVSKEDYRLMYEFLEGNGYDITKDIHQQFLDKWNVVLKKPMKYKKRGSNSINSYLGNGQPNPEYRKFKTKENPTD
jgi:ribosomal protein L35